MRVVFDTNVLISATLKKNSTPYVAFKRAIDKGNVLYSINTFKELSSKLLKPKFDKYVSVESRLEFLFEYRAVCESIVILHDINICRDPNDDLYLELALSGNADCIVTGDKDLLILHPFENISIISATDFLKFF